MGSQCKQQSTGVMSSQQSMTLNSKVALFCTSLSFVRVTMIGDRTELGGLPQRRALKLEMVECFQH